jgi:cytochrome c-type biogenesis protein CcmE
MKIQGKYIIAAILLLISIGLAYDSINNYVNPYLSVTQVVNNPSKYEGNSIQVIGSLVDDTIVRSDDGTLRFEITDNDNDIQVIYHGIPPQNIEQSTSIVVIGSLDNEGGLESNQLLVKCPSKYEEVDPTSQTSPVFFIAVGIIVLVLLYLIVTTLWKRG